MQFFRGFIFLLCLLGTLNSYAQKATYVIVHGAWGGAWQFKTTAQKLQAEGFTVYRPTLTGLGDRYHLSDANITLKTHINDVINTILFDNLDNIVLVGHSYGGMVVTGVADSIPERIKKVVYLDAIVPEDGQSAVESLGIDPSQISKRFKVEGDFIIPVWVRDTLKAPRDVPHPLATFTQPISLKNDKRLHLPTTYILTYQEAKGGEEKDDFYPFSKKALQNKWNLRKLEASHNPQIDKLDDLVNILIEEN